MQRRNVAVTDGFLPAGMLADLLDREVHFDEAFWVGGG